jgi:hypothetical protein
MEIIDARGGRGGAGGAAADQQANARRNDVGQHVASLSRASHPFSIFSVNRRTDE